MSLVVDSNLLVALALNDPRASTVDRHLREAAAAGETLHAPDLLRYETANALTRAVAVGHLEATQVAAAWERMLRVEVTLHALGEGPEIVALALRLQRSSAYDAAYLALAGSLEAELWSLDGPLARNAVGLGLRVRLLEPEPT